MNWTLPASGLRVRRTAQSGFLTTFPAVGLLIRMATGSTALRGDGCGLRMNRGATRRSTMGAGFHTTAVGDGFPDRRRRILCGHLHWLFLQAGSREFRRGSRWDPARLTGPGIRAARATLTWSTFPTLPSPTWFTYKPLM